MKTFKKINKEVLMKIYEDMNEQLKLKDASAELRVYGGAYMTTIADNRPMTSDVDCIHETNNENAFIEVVNNIREEYALSDDWINDEIKEPLRALTKEKLITFMELSNLKIIYPADEQVLAMKILSARPEPASDFFDAYVLCKRLKIDNKKDLIKVTCKYISPKLIGKRQDMFIKYLGEDLGYYW